MKLTINGETRDLENVESVADVLKALGLPAQACVVEYNGDALRRDEWTAHQVAEGDRLEVVRIAAGG